MEHIEQEQQETPALPGYIADTPSCRRFWQPNCASYEQGAAWAEEMVGYMAATGFTPILAWTIMDMPRGSDMGPAELGFFDYIAARVVRHGVQ